jgi:hypothetical protein
LIDHVIGAETAYARKLGVKLKQPAIDDIAVTEDSARRSPLRWGPVGAAHP